MSLRSTPAQHQVRFSIARLNAWAPGVTTEGEWREWARGERTIEESGEPALAQMPPMLRRHAGRLGRLACSPAYDTLGDFRDIPMVFSARYGEVSRSVDLLTALSGGEELSPTSFGLSVHNAVPGLFSMARKETANSISLAAGDDSAELGMIEACGLLADGAEQVLLVVADCPLPAIYRRFQNGEPSAYGWSCLLSRPTGPALCLSWLDTVDLKDDYAFSGSGALLPLAVLFGESTEFVRRVRVGQKVTSDPQSSPLGSDPTSHPTPHRVWRWSRDA